MRLSSFVLTILRVAFIVPEAAAITGPGKKVLRGSSQGLQSHLVAFQHGKPPDRYGETECPCVGIDQVDGKLFMLNATYPADAGSHCNAWEDNVYSECTGEGKKPDYCTQKWCYVDPCKCSIGTLPKMSTTGATYQGRKLYYSYATCGSKDHWTSTEDKHSCFNQHSEEDCTRYSKCAWDVDLNHCGGKEVIDLINTCKKFGSSEKDGGLNSCRCIGIHGRKGYINGSLGIQTLDIGSQCNKWELDYHKDCKGDISTDPSWCHQKWCYVDPCDCQMDGPPPRVSNGLPDATFQGRPLYYSYHTCGSDDGWTATRNKGACVMQKTEKLCNANPKCSWTGERCLGSDLVTCTQWVHHEPEPHDSDEKAQKKDDSEKKHEKESTADKKKSDDSHSRDDEDEDKCPETSFNLTFDGHVGNFLLPEKNKDSVVAKKCKFGNKSYLEGNVRFVCLKGAWAFKNHECADCPSKGCPATRYSVELSGQNMEYELTCDSDGAISSQECSSSEAKFNVGQRVKCRDKGKPWMYGKVTSADPLQVRPDGWAQSWWWSEVQDARFAVGSVDFECAGGEWKFKEHTCGASAGTCLETNYTVELSSHTGQFFLPLGGNGSKIEMPCEFKGKTYKEGAVKFECEKGSWDLKSTSCYDCPSDGCPSTEYTVFMGDRKEVFELQCTDDGAKVEKPCEFEGKVYKSRWVDEGSLSFVCSKGEWQYSSQTCSERYDGKVEIKNGKQDDEDDDDDEEDKGEKNEKTGNVVSKKKEKPRMTSEEREYKGEKVPEKSKEKAKEQNAEKMPKKDAKGDATEKLEEATTAERLQGMLKNATSTGWARPVEELNFGSHHGLVGYYWRNLDVIAQFAKKCQLSGVDTDFRGQPYEVQISDDGNNWQTIVAEARGSVTFGSPVRATFGRLKWASTQGSNGIRAQFRGICEGQKDKNADKDVGDKKDADKEQHTHEHNEDKNKQTKPKQVSHNDFFEEKSGKDSALF